MDLKIGNVLLNDKWLPVVCDWGNAKDCSQTYPPRSVGGTSGYQPPENFLEKENVKYGVDAKKFDAYSLGVIMHLLKYKTQPFNKEELQQMEKTGKRPLLGNNISAQSKGIKQVMYKLLAEKPHERWTP